MNCAASGVMAGLDDLVEVFELLGDWDQRYRYLIELGEALPPLPEFQRTEANRVRACMSRVWVSASRDPDGRVQFLGDSDTAVIKGILALLIRLASGHSAAEIETLDLDALFDRLNLDEHLSPTRHVGVYAMVEQMKRAAADAPRDIQAVKP